jgi:hypothetical protein
MFCAANATNCVFDQGASRLQITTGTTRCALSGTDAYTTRTCTNGAWGSSVACANYVCNGTTACYTDCEVNLDTRCVAPAHCDLDAGPDICNADHGATAACEGNQDCISNACVTSQCN